MYYPSVFSVMASLGFIVEIHPGDIAKVYSFVFDKPHKYLVALQLDAGRSAEPVCFDSYLDFEPESCRCHACVADITQWNPFLVVFACTETHRFQTKLFELV